MFLSGTFSLLELASGELNFIFGCKSVTELFAISFITLICLVTDLASLWFAFWNREGIVSFANNMIQYLEVEHSLLKDSTAYDSTIGHKSMIVVGKMIYPCLINAFVTLVFTFLVECKSWFIFHDDNIFSVCTEILAYFYVIFCAKLCNPFAAHFTIKTSGIDCELD